MAKTEIVLASGNASKLREFNQLLAGSNLIIRPQEEFNTAEVEETGLSFVENALIKARNAAQTSGLPALADDSGIEVDALKGRPGIHSARYAGPNSTDADNVSKLLYELEGIHEDRRAARFQCVLVYLRHTDDATPLIYQGTWEGRILDKPQGNNGFGYDPVFYVSDHDCSAAELKSSVKNRISHRGQALEKLLGDQAKLLQN